MAYVFFSCVYSGMFVNDTIHLINNLHTISLTCTCLGAVVSASTTSKVSIMTFLTPHPYAP